MLKVKHNLSIFCLLETNFNYDTFEKIKQFNCFHKIRINSVNASGGVAVYVKQNINVKEVNLNTPL